MSTETLDWNYDYDPESGPSMMCPKCGETEDVHTINRGDLDSLYPPQQPHCDACGFTDPGVWV